MDEALFPDLADFVQSGSASLDFPLDPSLGGPVASTSRLGGGSSAEDSWDEGDDSVNEDEYDDDDDDDDGSETDAEDEYRAAAEGSAKRTGARLGGTLEGIENGKGKGKGREVFPGEEGEDDGELGRLIHAIRDSATTTVGGRTALDKEFDRSIEEEMEDLDGFAPGKKGAKGKGGKKTLGRRAVAELEPSSEVKGLLGMANRYYAMGEHEQAEEHLKQVITIDAAIRAPWYTLATIYEERGDKEKALMFKIVATHLASAKAAAPEWAELGAQSRELGLLQQAIYCYTQAIKGNKSDVDSMWDRAHCLKLSQSDKLAITAFTALLNIHPHDPGVLRELAPLLAATNQHAKACSLYLAALDYFRTTVPHVDPRSAASMEQISSFGFQDLEALADFLAVQRQPAKIVAVIKQGVRWLQGREKETGWDALGDDREYDVERRQRLGWEKDSKLLETAEPVELDVRLRVRLGVARMMEGRLDEAKHHFKIVLEEDVAEFPELFGAVADSYFDAKMFSDALDVYQDMAENEDTNGPAVWIKIAQCNHQLGDLEQAKECYEAVALEEPANLFSKMQLAKVYEQMGEPARALATINEIIEARRLDPGATEENAYDNSRESSQRPNGRRGRQPLTKEDRQRRDTDRIATEEQRHHEFALAFQKLDLLEPGVDDVEWLEVATHLVDAFRETRQLFPSDTKRKFTGVLSRGWRRKGVGEIDLETQADEMATRLHRTMNEPEDTGVEVDTFRGKDFDGWMALIIKYAFLLAKNDEVESGQETLEHVQEANIFKQSESRTLTIRLARVALYLYAKQHNEAVLVLRWLWLRYQFQAHPLRLIQALLPQGVGSVDAFNQGNFQKFTSRQIRMCDDAIAGKGPTSRRGKAVDHEQEDDDDGEEDATPVPQANKGFKVTKPNPLMFVQYGIMLLLSRSYQSAIIYLLRAHELAPNQPLIILCLAVAYLHRAMVRQTDNRQHQIAQSLGFLSMYRKLKGSTQEVEYNFGRAFQHLGLQSYAVKHYEVVLKLATAERLAAKAGQMEVDDAGAEDDDDDDASPNDFAKVAAYNLTILYTTTGSEDLARGVARRWLAV